MCVMHYFKSKKYTIYTKAQKLKKKKLQRLRPKGMWWRWNGVALWRPAKIGERGKIILKTIICNYLIPALKDWTLHSRQVQMPDFGQPGWNRAAVLQLPRIWLQRELGHGWIFRRIFCWWNSTDGDDFLGSSWHSANHVHTFSLNWRKSNWIQSLIIILPLQCQLLLAFCAIYFFRFTFIFGILLWMFIEINDLEWKLVCFENIFLIINSWRFMRIL